MAEPSPGEPEENNPLDDNGIADPRSVKYKVTSIILGIVAGFILSSLFTFIAAELEYGSIRKLAGATSLSPPVTIASLLGLWAGLLVAVMHERDSRGTGSLVRDFGFKFRWKTDLPLGVAVGLGSQIVLLPLIYLPFQLNDPHFDTKLSKPARELVGSAQGFNLLLIGIFVAIGAPLVEELFFRGLMLRSLDAYIGPIGGIAISAVVFGLLHAETIQLLGLVIFGAIQAFMALKLNRLGAGIISHATFNGIAVISLAIVGH